MGMMLWGCKTAVFALCMMEKSQKIIHIENDTSKLYHFDIHTLAYDSRGIENGICCPYQ